MDNYDANLHRRELLQTFNLRRVRAEDGLAVTAQVWQEAHDYHSQQQRLHALFGHGAGIVTGLEVIASDPSDRSVYILPGVAIDPAGRAIVLPEPVIYDFGDEIEGFLHLLLVYREGQPRYDREHLAEQPAARGAYPAYVRDEFVIVAPATLPEVPAVELARLTRSERRMSIRDAVDPARPAADEIDLRFRQELDVAARTPVTMAVCYLGQVNDGAHGRGAYCMARAPELRYMGYQVVVDDDRALDPGVLAYTIVYLVGSGPFELSRSQIKGLQGYIERGGTLFVESRDLQAYAALVDVAAQIGVELAPVELGHPLLQEPYLFAEPPVGYDALAGVPGLSAGGGVVLGARNYGRLWQAEREAGVPSREEIRAATEWGVNLVAFALARRESAERRRGAGRTLLRRPPSSSPLSRGESSLGGTEEA